MYKKILLIIAIFLLILVLGAELASPRLIEHFVGKEIKEIEIDDFQMSITSKRPYLLRIINNDLAGTLTIEEYTSVIKFEQIEAHFSGFGLQRGDIGFVGLVPESELSQLIKANWDEELSIILTKGYASVSVPVKILFVEVDASIKGVFNVKANNEIIFDVLDVKVNVPGLKNNVEQFVRTQDLSLSLAGVPNINIEKIDIEEGYLLVTGTIQ